MRRWLGLELNGASVSRTVTRAGQDVRIAISASASQRLNIGLMNAGSYAEIELLQPDGTPQNTTTLFTDSKTDIDTASPPRVGRPRR